MSPKHLSKEQLQAALLKESELFKQSYNWLEAHMPAPFFEQVEVEHIFPLVHTLMELNLSDFFSHIHLKDRAFVLSLDTPDADLKVLRHYCSAGIGQYHSFVSTAPPLLSQEKLPLRISQIIFSTAQDPKPPSSPKYEIALQPQGHYKLTLSWKDLPRATFLWRVAQLAMRNHLHIQEMHATVAHGTHFLSLIFTPSETTLLPQFEEELMMLKYFEPKDSLERTFIETQLCTAAACNFLSATLYFIHQALVPLDLNLYSLEHIEEGLCRHSELSAKLFLAFEAKFHPQRANIDTFNALKAEYMSLVEHLDTGHALNDLRRKTILTQGMHFVSYTLKTNYYCKRKTALAFRLDPDYLNALPFDRKEKFPQLPFGIFFIKGLHFIGFHIRFRDLSRGGLRTILPKKLEQTEVERNNVFFECYNLAYTQNKKNKDIPEGGSKAVIFLEPYAHAPLEEAIDLKLLGSSALDTLRSEHQRQALYQTQRAYIKSLLSLVNCDEKGDLRAPEILDYYRAPEYLYLGPDENMHNTMIEWISAYSLEQGYTPGSAFISSKPGAGINHKEFGVTSLGVNVYMEEVLRYMGIDPKTETFTVKMSGGPDGDVAGNQMENLYNDHPDTAKLLATVDISGTIFDPQGLKLPLLHQLFKEGKPLRFYPPQELHEGGFLLDAFTKKEESTYVQRTLCYKKVAGKLIEEWLLGDEMNRLLRHTVPAVKATIFIPGGGRPRTLSETNYTDFLDDTGQPTARAIVEGANLYLTSWARHYFEKLGTLIIKDSSANKGGVICSSFEVLFGLILSEAEFLHDKTLIVSEILTLIKERAREEAQLLLRTHKETGVYLSDISDQISERINAYKDELLHYLQPLTLSSDPQDPLIRCLFNYAPLLLRSKYKARLLSHIPDIHKKAIIACHIASRIVYFRGLKWAPSLIDILPLIAQDPQIIGGI